MNIKEELLKEHSLANTIRIATHTTNSDRNLKELFDCFINENYRLAQRAAWVVSHFASKNPAQIKPYISLLVDQLDNTNAHPAVIRNTVRVLQQIEIPPPFHGKVMNACFSFIENPKTPAAIKAFALTTLNNLAEFYPEIKSELKLIIEERWDVESPAFKSRAKRILFSKAKTRP